ncbi:MAG: hypothetical protein R3E79_43860 [Caldilineaceae bacterium]
MNATSVDEGDPQQGAPTPGAPLIHTNLGEASRRDPSGTPASGPQELPTAGLVTQPAAPAPSHRTRVRPTPPAVLPQAAISNTEAHVQRIRRTVFPQMPSLPVSLATELASPAIAPAEESALPPPQAPMGTARPTPVEPPQRQVHLTQPVQAQPVRQPGGHMIPMVTSKADAPFQPLPITNVSPSTSPATPGEQPVFPGAGSVPSAMAGTAKAQPSAPVTPPGRCHPHYPTATGATAATGDAPGKPPEWPTGDSGDYWSDRGARHLTATGAQPPPTGPRRSPAAPQPALSLDAYLNSEEAADE